MLFDNNDLSAGIDCSYMGIDATRTLDLSKNSAILSLRTLSDDYDIVDRFLADNLFGSAERPRSKEFLVQKRQEWPDFFIGLFSDECLVGVVQGFPRDDYLLLSELAISSKYRNRGFGRLLVQEFERRSFAAKFGKIKLGAMDDAIAFYSSLGYLKSVMIQIDSSKLPVSYRNILATHEILSKFESNGSTLIEIGCENIHDAEIERLKNELCAYSIQYLFTKSLAV